MKKIYFLILTTLLLVLTLFSVRSEVISSEGKLYFCDAKESAWYYDSLEFCYANGFIKGISDYEAAPSKVLRREEAVCVLARISGDDISGYDGNYFTDTKSGKWYSNEIAWAYEKGYINGIGNNRFGLGRSMTREEFAKIIYHYALERGLASEVSTDLSNYSDKAEISSWAQESVAWCVESKLMQGTKENVFSPKSELSRAQITKITESFIKEVAFAECEHLLTEPSCTEPSKCENCGIVFEMPLGHRCEELNCVSGSECSECGELIENDSLIHNFAKATCVKSPTCVDCGESYGKALGHDYSAASCTSAASCKRCGVKNGAALGHKFSAASCTKAQTCSACGATKGYALGHTTYNGKCSRCNTYNYRKKIIKVDNIYQMKDYPNGCESVSTVMALRYLGVNISVDDFIDYYLPMGSAPTVGGRGPDPDKVYCGNPRSKGGWGCYSPVIVKALKNLLDESTCNIYHSYSYSLKELCDRYIDKDIPVIVWATINMENASYPESYAYWTTPEGKRIAYNRRLHCLLLVGYDENNYYFNDPTVNGNFCLAYSKSASERAFALLGSQSVAVSSKG